MKYYINEFLFFVGFLFLCLFCFHTVSAQEKVYYYYYDSSKVRLSPSINNYQPVIMPHLSFDGQTLYFDRKFHPLNTGSTSDIDDIWSSKRITDYSWSTPENISELNTVYSDVLFNITPDENYALIYGEYNNNSPKIPGFSISERQNGKWAFPRNLKINNYYNDSTRYFGFINPEKNILILSLSRKNSKGGMDLYLSRLNKSDDTWSEPENLTDLNSNANEVCPVLAFDGKTIYFSSDRKDGKGNYDVYVSKAKDNDLLHWTVPQTIGDTVNSKIFSENSFCLNANSDRIYYVSSDTSSKRPGIYVSDLSERVMPDPYLIIKGQISLNSQDLDKFQQITILFIDKSNNDTIAVKSNPDRSCYSYVLKANKEYSMQIHLPGYKDFEKSISTENITKIKITEINIILIKDSQVSIEENKAKNLKNKKFEIHFDLNSSVLSDEESKILSSGLNQKSKINLVKIYAFTDTLGTEKYNLILSAKRAKAVKDFLIELGIKTSIISTEAKGETNIFGEAEKNRYALIELEYEN